MRCVSSEDAVLGGIGILLFFGAQTLESPPVLTAASAASSSTSGFVAFCLQSEKIVGTAAGLLLIFFALFRVFRRNNNSYSKGADVTSDQRSITEEDKEPAKNPSRKQGTDKTKAPKERSVKDIEDLANARANLHVAQASLEKARKSRRVKLRSKRSLIPLTLDQMKEKNVVPLTFEDRVGKLSELNALEQPSFRSTVEVTGGGCSASKLLERVSTVVFQINIGLYCNQACEHCHVDSSPLRKEMMSRKTADQCLKIIRNSPSVQVVDITGGAPELNQQFRYFVTEARKMGKEVIDRCNLTVLLEPHQDDLAEFLAENNVHVIASLPCYLEDNVDGQRGDMVFERSIGGLRKLNEHGYGKPGSGLVLDLVYNPTGFNLAPPASQLEGAYKRELEQKYGIVFSKLICITNMPINRYYDHLKREGKLDFYMNTLVKAFNPDTVGKLMCKSYCSVDFNGDIFDCDFNQQVDLRPGRRKSLSVFEIECTDDLQSIPIATGLHCYGCTAGQGSS